MMRRIVLALLVMTAVMVAGRVSAASFWIRTKSTNGKYGYMELSEWSKKSSSNWKIAPMFEDCARVIYEDGYAAVKADGKWGIIDSRGRFVLKPQLAELAAEDLTRMEFEENPLIAAKADKDGLWGAVNKHGEFVLPPVYDRFLTKTTFGGKPMLALSNGKLSCIAPTSEPIFVTDFSCSDASGYEYADIKRPSTMFMSVRSDGKWGIIGRNGKFVVKPALTYIGNWYNGLAIVNMNGKWGVVDRAFRFLIKARYDSMEYKSVYGGCYFIVSENGRFGAIDMNGDVIVPIKQKSADKVSEKKCNRIVSKKVDSGAYQSVKNSLEKANEILATKLEQEVRKSALSHADSVELGRQYNEKALGFADIASAAYWHNRAAWLGNADSQSAMASILNNRSFIPNPPYATIFALLSKAKESGNHDNADVLGDCYLYGRGTQRDCDRAIEEFTRVMSRYPSSKRILSRLGDCYYSLGDMGSCMVAREFYLRAGDRKAAGQCNERIAKQEKEYESAQKQFELRKKNVRVTAELANAYNSGLDRVNRGDYRNAYRYFKVAADMGYTDAVVHIIELYDRGYPGFTDNSQKIYWLKRLAEDTGFVHALSRVGQEYLRTGDFAEAFRWFKMAADAGDSYSQNIVGAYYVDGNVVKRNLPKALEYFRKAAEQNMADAKCALAEIYAQMDEHKVASYWYRSSCEQGFPVAMIAMGRYYTSNICDDIKKDMAKAKRYYVAAYMLGQVEGTFNVGACYYNDNDYVTARYWFEKDARDNGNVQAMLFAGLSCEKIGDEDGNSYAMAYEWFHKAAVAGSSKAMLELARFYATGDYGVKQDAVLARKWYDLAVATGEDFGLKGVAVEGLVIIAERYR